METQIKLYAILSVSFDSLVSSVDIVTTLILFFGLYSCASMCLFYNIRDTLRSVSVLLVP